MSWASVVPTTRYTVTGLNVLDAQQQQSLLPRGAITAIGLLDDPPRRGRHRQRATSMSRATGVVEKTVFVEFDAER